MLSSKSNNERGVYLPIFAGIIVSVFVIGGFALEISNHFLSQHRIQRAFDAAVTNASLLRYQLLTRSFEGATLDAELRDAVATHLRANLIEMGVLQAGETLPAMAIAPCPNTLNDSYTPYDDARPESLAFAHCEGRLFLAGEIEAPLLLLSAFPGFPALAKFSTAATSETQRASVVLVLDVSGSMDFDVNNASFDCRNGAENCNSKIEALRRAGRKFIEKLIPGDELAIIDFSQTPRIHVGLSTIKDNNPFGACEGEPRTADSQSLGCYLQKIDALQTRWQATNIYAGLATAQGELLRVPPSANNRFVVILSDGDPAGHTRQLDWTFWGLSSAQFESYIRASCVDLNYIPEIDTVINQNGSVTPNISHHRQMYYAAINMADFIRESNTRIIAIGFGAEFNPRLPDGTFDIYNSNHATDNTLGELNHILLHRIANQRPNPGLSWPEYRATSADIIWRNGQASTEPSNGCVQSYEQLIDAPIGVYKNARSEAELNETFEWVGRRIRMRLTR